MTCTVRVGVRVALLYAVFLASPAAAQKVDLSQYLGGVPSLGDTRIYSTSGGGTLLQEVVQVQLTKKAWRVVVRQQETGKPEVLVETFIVLGKQQLLGDTVSEPLSIDVNKPKKVQKFKYTVGKQQRAKIKGYAYTNFSDPFGPALTLWQSEFLGFESIDTPLGSFVDTARLTIVAAQGVVHSLTGDEVSAATWQTSWISPLLGPVAVLRSTTTYLNGVQQSDTGIETLTLEYALIDGVEFF